MPRIKPVKADFVPLRRNLSDNISYIVDIITDRSSFGISLRVFSSGLVFERNKIISSAKILLDSLLKERPARPD